MASRLGWLALILYLASFLLPEHYCEGPLADDFQAPPTRFYGVPEGGLILRPEYSPSPASAREYYFFPQMVAEFVPAWGKPLFLGGWIGHAAALMGCLLVLAGWNRLALLLAIIGLYAGIELHWFCGATGFRAGYYLWLASLIAVGLIAAGQLAFRVKSSEAALSRRARHVENSVCVAVIAAGLVVVALLSFLTGPRDAASYPAAEDSPYRLPWPSGVAHQCTQGNWGTSTHRGTVEFAYDFGMPEGSDVCAARAGRVSTITMNDSSRASMNFIEIDHGDGTVAMYGHLLRGGTFVHAGEQVLQGRRIGVSGTSKGPHLHFHVNTKGQLDTLPVTFVDVASDRGIPRFLKWYTSGNQAAAP